MKTHSSGFRDPLSAIAELRVQLWRIRAFTAKLFCGRLPPASCGTNCGMKVTIKNWHAVASWTWTTEDDVCGICRAWLSSLPVLSESFVPRSRAPSRASRCALSQICRSTGVRPVRRVQETTRLSFGAGCALSLLSHTTPCPPLLRAPHGGCFAVLTQCSHYFHLMCITTWLHNKNTCPICRRKWEFASAPKPAPATPGTRRHGEGFAVAEAAAPVED